MPTKTVPVKVFGVSPTDKLSVLVEQIATGLFLDPSDNKFKALDKVANPLLPLPAGPAGTLREKVGRADLVIDPAKGWADGRYTVTFYDVSAVPRPFDEEVFEVWMGEWRPFTTTDVVWRLLDAKASDKSTVRQAFAKLDAIYLWVSKQPGFVA